jgi:hypothetical protein
VSLAAITYERGFFIDDFMADVTRRLSADGVRLCGLVQQNGGPENCASMTLIDITSTEAFGISQALGACARGCRLDPHGLVEAGMRLEGAIGAGADLLVLNKFGKAEAEEGGGLRGAVARAMELDIPVLTAVRPPYDQSWAEFHGGYAAALPPQLDAVLAWCTAAVAARRGTPVPGVTPEVLPEGAP